MKQGSDKGKPPGKGQMRGRKTLFKKEMIEEGEKLGGLGLREEDMALFWGVNSRTLSRWKKKNPEFCQAIKRGKMRADVTVIQALFRAARDGNITGMIFWLKNRLSHLWRDKGPEVNVQTNVQIVNQQERKVIDHLGKLSPERRQRIFKILDGLASKPDKGDQK